MEKSGVANRGGTSRFSQQKLLAGLENPKKERLIKKLSVVNKAASSSFEDSVMGCNNNSSNLSDGENEIPLQPQSSMSNATAKRLKLAKKFFYDCDGVDHSCVPRKLRSAMKKRRESISPPLPDSNKLNHAMGGTQSLKKDGLKKSNVNMKQGSADWSQKPVAGPITKDEEEVVETLFAMAGMFPDNDSAGRYQLETVPSEAKPPAFPENREVSGHGIKVTKEFDINSPMRTSIADPPSSVESAHKETDHVPSVKELSAEVEENPNLHSSVTCLVKTDSFVPSVNVHSTMPLLAKREHTNDKPSCNPVKFQVLPELRLDPGKLEQSTEHEASVTRTSEFAFVTTTFKNQEAQENLVMGSRKNGLALWPGLSPLALHGAGSPGASSQSVTDKIPAWLDAAVGASPPYLLENGALTGKVCKKASNSSSRKRCSTHVYISHLIRDFQVPQNIEKLPTQCNQLKPSDEGQRQEADMVIHDFDRVKKGLNGATSANNIGSSTLERNSSGANSGILQHNMLSHDHPQTTTAARLHSMQNQNFNFLSVSTGSERAETPKSFNKTRNNALEASSQFQVSYLHAYPQHQKFMPITTPQSHYNFSYSDKPPTCETRSTQQVQLQLAPYLSNPSMGQAHASSTHLPKEHQQQQQQLWAAQLAAHCRPPGHSTAMSQFSNWPNERHDPALIPCPQPLVSPSPSTSSLDMQGLKYSSTFQQQHQHQQLMAITASSRVRRHDHRLPLVYEEIEGGFRTSGSLPLHLLCNERL